jgi:hypothetical protein
MRGWADSSRRDAQGGARGVGRGPGRRGRAGVARRRASDLALLMVYVLAMWMGSACAVRRSVPASIPSGPAPIRVETRAAPGGTPSEPVGEALPRLPGTNRVYPSQDPRNQAKADAPEAFPLGGAVAGSVAGKAAADSVDEGSGSERVAEAPPAGSAVQEPAAAGSAPAPSSPSPVWSVQVLASSSISVARERAEALAPFFSEPLRVEPAGGLFKVRVGRCATRDGAEALRRKAIDAGLRDAFVVPVNPDDEPSR